MKDADSQGGGMGTGNIWELPAFSTLFCYESKTALKNKLKTKFIKGPVSLIYLNLLHMKIGLPPLMCTNHPKC